MVNWILEDGVFGSPVAPLVQEIERQGHQVKVIDYARELTDYKHFFPADECILFHGSLQIAEQIQGTSTQPGLAWVPGVLGTVDHYYCTHYYPHLEQWLLNRQHWMLPLAELSQRIAWGDPTLATLRGHNRLFIRPDSPTKPFPGNVHSVPNLIHLQNVIKRDYSDQMLVVVAPEQPIEAEWRAVIADGQVLTASQYKQNNQPKYCLGLPDAVQALAKTVAGGWQPDPIWILDLGWVDGAAYIVEIGMFSCAAFYHCDLSSIVEAASTIAQLKWADQPYQP